MNTTFIKGETNYIMTGTDGLIFMFDPEGLPYALLANGSWDYNPSAKRYIYDSQYSFVVLEPSDFIVKDGKTIYIGNIKPEDVDKVIINEVESKKL